MFASQGFVTHVNVVCALTIAIFIQICSVLLFQAIHVEDLGTHLSPFTVQIQSLKTSILQLLFQYCRLSLPIQIPLYVNALDLHINNYTITRGTCHMPDTSCLSGNAMYYLSWLVMTGVAGFSPYSMKRANFLLRSIL